MIIQNYSALMGDGKIGNFGFWIGAMAAEKDHGGSLVTFGIFTQEAKYFVESKPIQLIDGFSLYS